MTIESYSKNLLNLRCFSKNFTNIQQKARKQVKFCLDKYKFRHEKELKIQYDDKATIFIHKSTAKI